MTVHVKEILDVTPTHFSMLSFIVVMNGLFARLDRSAASTDGHS